MALQPGGTNRSVRKPKFCSEDPESFQFFVIKIRLTGDTNCNNGNAYTFRLSVLGVGVGDALR